MSSLSKVIDAFLGDNKQDAANFLSQYLLKKSSKIISEDAMSGRQSYITDLISKMKSYGIHCTQNEQSAEYGCVIAPNVDRNFEAVVKAASEYFAASPRRMGQNSVGINFRNNNFIFTQLGAKKFKIQAVVKNSLKEYIEDISEELRSFKADNNETDIKAVGYELKDRPADDAAPYSEYIIDKINVNTVLASTDNYYIVGNFWESIDVLPSDHDYTKSYLQFKEIISNPAKYTIHSAYDNTEINDPAIVKPLINKTIQYFSSEPYFDHVIHSADTSESVYRK